MRVNRGSTWDSALHPLRSCLFAHFVPWKVSGRGCLPPSTYSCVVSKMSPLLNPVPFPWVMAAAAAAAAASTLWGPMLSEPQSPSYRVHSRAAAVRQRHWRKEWLSPSPVTWNLQNLLRKQTRATVDSGKGCFLWVSAYCTEIGSPPRQPSTPLRQINLLFKWRKRKHFICEEISE